MDSNLVRSFKGRFHINLFKDDCVDVTSDNIKRVFYSNNVNDSKITIRYIKVKDGFHGFTIDRSILNQFIENYNILNRFTVTKNYNSWIFRNRETSSIMILTPTTIIMVTTFLCHDEFINLLNLICDHQNIKEINYRDLLEGKFLN
jgi:hypothetical protein